ncbi:hypothetical protein HUJ04_010293 [Dendroctonus ponderosae]|nr:hypothetical protein HUJ04_010293 [Dendroctonus ponderosae]
MYKIIFSNFTYALILPIYFIGMEIPWSFWLFPVLSLMVNGYTITPGKSPLILSWTADNANDRYTMEFKENNHIESGNHVALFTITDRCCVTLETVDGKAVLTVNPIDRDAKDLSTYAFRIMAQEEDDPPYNVTLDITFILEDIDDNSPLFKQVYFSDGSSVTLADGVTKIIEFSFLENFAETINGTIWIRDIDTGENAQFSVELVEDKDREYQNETYTQPFLIVPTAGYKSGNFSIPVKNNTKLDFENETWQNFSFYVHSWDKNETNQDLLLVKIHLIDYNDELPIFGEEYSVDVNETIEKGEKLIQVKATDRDAEDAILEHELVGANAIIKLMEIDHAEGIITVAVDDAFDYDRINPVIFQVQAIDAVRHTTTVSVTVNLLDVNNKAPTYKVSDVIRVDENQKIGDRLNVTITASDVDTTRNLTAEIDWENSFAMKNSQKLTSTAENLKAMRFLDLDYEIDPTANDTIEIYLAINNNNDDQTAPDYETFDTLYLNVTIIDHNTKLPEFADKMSIQALIVVNINDINDNEPIFTDDTIARNRTVYERVKNGTLDTVLGQIQAKDIDEGANAEIEMHVLTVFKISEDGEEDYTAEELFDTQKGEDSEYRVNDTVKQWNLIAKKDLKDYYGNFVIQMNDQEPEKPLSMYRNSETFGNITIRDGAENEGCIDKWIPRFDVSVVNDFGVSTKNFFTIASLGDCTGQLQVTDLYNKEDVVDIVTFQVRITAILADVTSLDENEAPYSQSIDIKLQFVDINDDPIFDPTSWNTTIREGDASLIIPINDHKAFYPNLDDGDDDPPSIYYFLKSDDADILSTFSIELNTGNIKLQTALDYLNSRSYQFKMLCSRNNSAVSSKSASILDVNVEVIEINNHIPQWTQKSFYGAILKSTQKNSIVLTINILETISKILGWNCQEQNIDKNTVNGIQYDNVTVANIYCMDNSTLLTTDDLKAKLNNINTFQQLKRELLEHGILLQTFDGDSSVVVTLETNLKVALIAVSVILGALCLILAITFFFKTRELTERKFGSDESTINRKGINAPNTNVFAVEGSNPVFKNDFTNDDKIPNDASSIHSGNSDLVGVEDNPDFDEMFGKEKF